MGAETKYPQYTLPRALKSIGIPCICSQRVIPVVSCRTGAARVLPHPCSGRRTVCGGTPGCRTGGLPDHSALHRHCIPAAISPPSKSGNCGTGALHLRWRRTVPCRSSLCKVHPKYKTPYMAVLVVGIINIILIATGSNQLYRVGIADLTRSMLYDWLSGLLPGPKKHYRDMKRPYRAPAERSDAMSRLQPTLLFHFRRPHSASDGAVVTVAAIVCWAAFHQKA